MINDSNITVREYPGKLFGGIGELGGSPLYDVICAEYYYCDEGVSYYHAYHNLEYLFHPFVVYAGDVPVMAMACTIRNDSVGFFHFPARIFYAELLSPEMKHKAAQRLLNFLASWFEKNHVKNVHLIADPYFTAKYFFNIRKVTCRHFGVIDLSLPENEIRGSLRKSYKSLINWGKKELEIRTADQSNVSPSDFEEFRDFHLRIAGRKTRSDSSWRAQYEAVRKGRGFATFGYLGRELVAATFVQGGMQEAFYAVGVYDRHLMAEGKAIAHYPLFSSILYAKKAGFRIFNMDELDTTNEKTEKQNNIAFFKKGFVNALRPEVQYHFVLAGQDPGSLSSPAGLIS